MAESKKELSKKDTFLISLSNFLQKNRIIFIIIIIALIVGIIAFTVVRESINNRVEKSTALAEEAQELYNQWVTEVDDSQKQVYREDCFELTDRIIEKYPKFYAAQRALFIRGNIYFDEENWQESSAAFESLYRDFPDSYLAPIALNNASVAYENEGKTEEAVDTLVKLTEAYKDSFPDVARIYFTKGRLYEELGDTEKATGEYEILVDDFPNSNWTKLARNRIIALEN